VSIARGMKFARTIASLVRPLLSLNVVFSSLSVFLYYRFELSIGMFSLSAGVFLLASAASMINQAQERLTDARMKRTERRPLPASHARALYVGLGAGTAACLGLLRLWLGTTALAVALGLAALLLYNGLYTPLKRKTPQALLVGAMVGALPALIGCASAIGRLDRSAVFIAIFMFFWQVPHFLQLLIKHREDYAHAGLATLASRMTDKRLTIISAAWTLAACITAALFPLLGILRNNTIVIIALALTFLTAARALFPLKFPKNKGSTRMLYFLQFGVHCALIVQGYLVARRVFSSL